MSQMEMTFVYDLDAEQLKIASIEDRIVSRLVAHIDSEDPKQNTGEYDMELSPGAEITFSTTVSDKDLYNWLQRFGFSLLNRYLEKRETRRILKESFQKHGILKFGWTIIYGIEGGYTDLKNENNKSIERSNKIILNNTPIEIVEEIATELCVKFKQQSVLIHDLEKNTYKYWKVS